jgi:stage II sporulation protein D
MYNGVPVEIFYSASCGGRSELPSEVWAGADLPYFVSVDDDVHEEDAPWTLELTRRDVQQRLAKAGFRGRLEEVRIESRNESGRVARLRLRGLTPETIRGEPFRAALGYGELRSTAFQIERDGDRLRFTGRGYGHGVGLCTIGAARRARRGETAEAILNHYFPKLTIAPLD